MLAERVRAFLANMTERDVALLLPSERVQFIALCERWAKIARQMNDIPRVGVLYQLRDGRGRE